jgi:hypothetical protein
MLEILSCNNADKKMDIDQEIRDLGLKYRSEFVELNDKQKDLVVRFLEQELIKLI